MDFQLAPHLVVDYTHNLQLTASLLAAPLVVTQNIVALTTSWVVLSGVRVVDVLRFFTDIQHNHKAMYSCMFSHAVIEMCAYFWPVSREATVSTCTFHPGQAA